jgi:hypothetical protein
MLLSPAQYRTRPLSASVVLPKPSVFAPAFPTTQLSLKDRALSSENFSVQQKTTRSEELISSSTAAVAVESTPVHENSDPVALASGRNPFEAKRTLARSPLVKGTQS